jgi:hypothetical protein
VAPYLMSMTLPLRLTLESEEQRGTTNGMYIL